MLSLRQRFGLLWIALLAMGVAFTPAYSLADDDDDDDDDREEIAVTPSPTFSPSPSSSLSPSPSHSPSPSPSFSPSPSPSFSPSPSIEPDTGVLHARKFHDTNQNGIRDEDEEWLNGWTFQLKKDGQVVDEQETHTHEDEDGWVWFLDLEPGDYDLCEVVPSGWANTSGSNCEEVTVIESVRPGPGQIYLQLNDHKCSKFKITYIGHEGPTYTWKVEEIKGKDLSHFNLGLAGCFDSIVGTSPPGADIGTDGSTGFVGVKWDVSDSFDEGYFSVTLDREYPVGSIEALVKAGTKHKTGWIAGPICDRPGETPPVYVGNIYFEGLRLTSMCWTDEDTHRFRVRNPHPYDIQYTWDVVGTNQSGQGTAPANSDTFFYIEGTIGNPNTTRVFVNGVQAQVKAANSEPCKGFLDAIVYHDDNRDGTQDGGEPGLEGWDVVVSNDGGFVTTGTTAGTTGVADFLLPPGVYTVCQVPWPGWLNTTDQCTTVVIVSEEYSEVKFGVFQPSLVPILECVYTPEGSNTSWALWGYDNTDDQGLNVPVSANNNAFVPGGDLGQPVEFLPGRHVGVFWTEFSDAELGWYLEHPVTGAGGVSTATLGRNTCDEMPVGYIDALVFHDDNRNQTKDGGEADLEGWEVVVSGDGVVTTGTTDANGMASFMLLPGVYQVCEVLQDGWENTTDLCTSVTLGIDDVVETEFGNDLIPTPTPTPTPTPPVSPTPTPPTTPTPTPTEPSEETPTPTPTPPSTPTPTEPSVETPTPTLPTTTPTPSPTETPTPVITPEDEFEEPFDDPVEAGWIWINARPSLTEPTSGTQSGSIWIRATDNTFNFGIWQSPPEIIPGARGGASPEIDPGALLRARYTIKCDVLDRSVAPSIRIRTNDVNLTQANFRRIDSQGDGALSPQEGEAREYDLWFQGGRLTQGWNYLAFELINFDPNDDPDGAIFLDHVTVQSISTQQIATLDSTPLGIYHFDGDTEGWSSSPQIGDFAQPVAGHTDGRLTLKSTGNTNTFGFWTSMPHAIPDTQNWLLRAEFTVGSDQTDGTIVPNIRMRAQQSNFQQVAGIVVDSTGAAGNSPTAGDDITYPLWLPVNADVGSVVLSFDLMNFNPFDSPDATISLDSVDVRAFDPADFPI